MQENKLMSKILNMRKQNLNLEDRLLKFSKAHFCRYYITLRSDWKYRSKKRKKEKKNLNAREKSWVNDEVEGVLTFKR